MMLLLIFMQMPKNNKTFNNQSEKLVWLQSLSLSYPFPTTSAYAATFKIW